METMKKIAIIGSQDLAQQIAHLINTDNSNQKVIGFYDDFIEKDTLVKGLPILGKITSIEKDFSEHKFDELLIGIGYKHFGFRKKLFDDLIPKIPFATFVHSSCIVDKTAKIGKGSVLYPASIIDQNVIIEDNVLVNLGCCISHDSIIGHHSYLSPRVAIAGKVNVGECCFIGINATIIDGISVVENTTIGAATNVVKNIEQNGVFVGNPAKRK